MIYRTSRRAVLGELWAGWPEPLEAWFQGIPSQVRPAFKDRRGAEFLRLVGGSTRVLWAQLFPAGWSGIRKRSARWRKGCRESRDLCRLSSRPFRCGYRLCRALYPRSFADTRTILASWWQAVSPTVLWKRLSKTRVARKQPRRRRPSERFADGSPQETFLRAALIDLFAYRDQGLLDPGVWRFAFFWMAPVWVSYLFLAVLLIVAYFHGQAGNEPTALRHCLAALSLSCLTWLVLALAFTLNQIRFMRNARWSLREDDKNQLPAQIEGRVKTSTRLPARLAGFVAQTAFALVYVASIGVYLIAIQILKP